MTTSNSSSKTCDLKALFMLITMVQVPASVDFLVEIINCINCTSTMLIKYQWRILFFTVNRDLENAIIRPLPRVKRTLSEANAIPHVMQLLLTFDPRLVEKLVTLLNDIMKVCVRLCVCVHVFINFILPC